MHTKEKDFVERIFVTTARRPVLFFTTLGRAFKLKVYELPEAGRTAKGTAIVNLLNLSGEEKVTAVVPLDSEATEDGYLFMCTRLGIVKRTRIRDFASIRSNGIIALNLDEEDRLINVRYTKGVSDLILVSRRGQSIRFHESDVRPMGRTARGVIGIRLEPGDEVKGIALAEDGLDLLIVTSGGVAKRSPVEHYRVQARGGKGIKAITLTPRSGEVAGVRSVTWEDELMIITGEGILIRFAVKDVPRHGRTSQGVCAMRLGKEDRVLAIAKLAAEENGNGQAK